MSLPNRNAAMVVLSGGQDSTTCLGWALENFKRVHCVTFDYGQRHRIELEAASKVVGHFVRMTQRVIPHEIVKVGDIMRSASPLTNPHAELEQYSNHDEMEAIIGDRVEKTFVPMRNAVFLMLAANRAVAFDCGNLVTGVCQADNANYPDCRATFIDSAEVTINRALGLEDPSGVERGHFEIHAPLMNMSKATSIILARHLMHTYEALAWTHTAYDGKYPPVGHDHASILRAHGFEQAGVPDPLVLRAVSEGLMPLPATTNYEPSLCAEAGFPLRQEDYV